MIEEKAGRNGGKPATTGMQFACALLSVAFTYVSVAAQTPSIVNWRSLRIIVVADTSAARRYWIASIGKSRCSGLPHLKGSHILADALRQRAVRLLYQEQLKLENSRLGTVLHSKRLPSHDVEFR